MIALSFILLFLLVGELHAKQTWQRHIPYAVQDNKQVLGTEYERKNPGLPVRLIIPAIGVNADIQYVGIAAGGEMEVPTNTIDVGWLKLGPAPGQIGSAVVAGHFNGKNGEAGVFAHLDKLQEGDQLYIEDSQGISTTFVVRASRTYDPGYADEVFGRNDIAHLNLITCDGIWNENTKSYSKRLVVFADMRQ